MRDVLRPTASSRHLVPRPALVARLDASVRGTLTIVVAPAGFGKSVLVGQWASSRAGTVGRVSFAAGESPGTVARRLAAISEQVKAAPDCLFVLEGLDNLTPSHRDEVGALIEHAPPPAHFVVTTRADTLFPAVTARLRVRDDVAYLRAADLAFDRDAIRHLFDRGLERTLTTDDVESLWVRTEGWPAPIQFALSAARDAGHQYRAALQTARFDDAWPAYCRTEILSTQPEPVREFLRITAVPDRLTPALAAALTGRDDASEMCNLLGSLQLLAPVDGEFDDDGDDTWVRYNPLVRDVLRAEIEADDPTATTELLVAAARWHDARRSAADLDRAAAYLARAGEWEALWAHIARHVRDMHGAGRVRTVLSWLSAIPEPLVHTSPERTITQAAYLTLAGETMQADEALRSLGDLRALSVGARVAAATLRSTWVQGHLQPSQSMDAADEVERLVDALPPDEFLSVSNLVTPESTRTLAALARGRGNWYLGHPTEARHSLRAALDSGDTSVLSMLHVTGARAEIEAWSGSLTVATRETSQARRMAVQSLGVDHPFLIAPELAHADVLIERGDLARGRLALERAKEIGRALSFEVWRTVLTIEFAWLALVSGDPRRGLAILDAQRPKVTPPPLIEARRRALTARLLIATGDLARARLRLAYRDDTMFHDIAAVATQLALAAPDIPLARRALAAWPARLEFQEQLVHDFWCAAVDFADQDVDGGLGRMGDLAAWAESEGHVRLFLDAGPDARRVLNAAARHEPNGYFANVLRAERAASVGHEGSAESGPSLSARERVVLGHLAERLTYAEIADRLFISQNTVKSHAKSVYLKLGANGRREAVNRAEEIGLL